MVQSPFAILSVVLPVGTPASVKTPSALVWVHTSLASLGNAAAVAPAAGTYTYAFTTGVEPSGPYTVPVTVPVSPVEVWVAVKLVPVTFWAAIVTAALAGVNV